MTLGFRHHDSLRLFLEIARYSSFTEAAEALHMTKGAISYQVKTLEEDLGRTLFQRSVRGVALTADGEELLRMCRTPFRDIEASVQRLKAAPSQSLTVGVSTYFAARWLSPRLMSFLQDHPEIQLRLQPMIRLFDLRAQGVDLAIRWGDGIWDDVEVEPFLPLPAYPVGNADAHALVQRVGPEQAMRSLTLLRDHDDSDAWTDWLSAAGLRTEPRLDTLIVPDPNVRVQAVIDGQGIALMDRLIQPELAARRLYRLSDVELGHYGYFLARPNRPTPSDAVQAFVDWIGLQE